MAQQLRPQYKQVPGYLDIEVFASDDFHMDVVFDTDVSSLVFDGGVVDFQGNVSPLFTIATVSASGISIDLTDIEIESVPLNASYYVRGTIATMSRTYLAGKFIRVTRTE
jgi:hypothetical protein